MSAELALTSAQLFAALTTRASSISQAQMPLSPAECVRIMGGGVGERLKPAVLKFARLSRLLNKSTTYDTYQYTNLACFGRSWQQNVQQNVQRPEFCATGLLAPCLV